MDLKVEKCWFFSNINLTFEIYQNHPSNTLKLLKKMTMLVFRVLTKESNGTPIGSIDFLITLYLFQRQLKMGPNHNMSCPFFMIIIHLVF